MGAYFYVEKAAFIGTFVPVYGGGDATNYVMELGSLTESIPSEQGIHTDIIGIIMEHPLMNTV